MLTLLKYGNKVITPDDHFIHVLIPATYSYVVEVPESDS